MHSSYRRRTTKRSAREALAMEGLEHRLLFAFGLTTTSTHYTVDTGSGLVFSVLRGGTLSSTIHLGDLTSVKLNGRELLAPYSATNRYSHYEQGLSSSTVMSATVDPAGEWIRILCDDSINGPSGGITHYYIAKKGENNIYMASLPDDVTLSPGEGRFLAYLERSVFTNIEAPSNISANVGAVEGSDVFVNADGTTASKFYNNGRRMIENEIHGVTGTNIGAFMHMGNRERSSGGPFFKDHDFQTTGGATEIYNVTFSGHTQTEPYRQGLHGPYALQFTNGSMPAPPNYSFLEGVGIAGLIPTAQRGSLSGVASGVPAGNEVVVTLSNSSAQYWDNADPATGAFNIAGVLPGTYTLTLYSNELAVGTRTVTITAQQTTQANIVSTYFTPAATWRIGKWDGTPLGFLNADKIEIMHPSDVRMASWTATPNFVVGTNTDSQWPMAQFINVNNSQRITFNLTAAQAAAAQTLRIGITLGFEGGRNRITVNAGQPYAWTSAIPSASTDLNSRGITRGTWRGPNQLYTYNIPTSALRAGTNTIDLPVVSGSSGSGFLSPNVVYDCIDLVPTSSLTNAPVVSSITLTPSSARLSLNSQQLFTAIARDQFGAILATNFDFSTTFGSITPQGLFSSPSTPGAGTISVKAGTITATASVAALGPAPFVVTPASVRPSPTNTGTAALSVLGDDDNGEAALTYTWSAVGTPPGTVSFSINGTNAAKSTTVLLGTLGTYNLQVIIADASGNSTTSFVTVTYTTTAAHLTANQSSGTALLDTSGNNNNAQLSGSYSFVQGKLDNALKFTGGNASLPTGLMSSFSDFSIATWIKIDTLGAWSRVFDFGTGTTANMFLTPSAGGGPVRFAITTSGSAGEQRISGSSALPTGTWAHVAVTLTGNLGILYVNGVEVGRNSSMTLRPSNLGNTTLNYLGKSQYSADPALLASIDDFRIYSRGLSASEIGALFNPTATSISISPTTAAVPVASTRQFTATVLDQFGSTMPAQVVNWSASSGTIASNGLFTAPPDSGPVTIIASVASNPSIYAAATVVVEPIPLEVLSFHVNDGSAQRSRVNSITVRFNRAALLSAESIQLVRQQDRRSVELAYATTDNLSYSITFSGTGIVAGSLADGFYTLTVKATGVLPASTSSTAPMAANALFSTHRIFGDINGDARITNTDRTVFNAAYGASAPSSAYLWFLDYDGNGSINVRDLLQFSSRANILRRETLLTL